MGQKFIHCKGDVSPLQNSELEKNLIVQERPPRKRVPIEKFTFANFFFLLSAIVLITKTVKAPAAFLAVSSLHKDLPILNCITGESRNKDANAFQSTISW